MKLSYCNRSASKVISDYRLRKVVTKVPSMVLELENRAEAEVSIAFVDDDEMRSLNKQYRGKDKTTDVLSFALSEGEDSAVMPDVIGDIIISLPVAARQAEEYDTTIDAEIARLLVHGTLHLLGYDHMKPGDEKIMFPLQEEYLASALQVFAIKS
ncbi:rRNA maturation RNase YbeY [Candidatus Sumerlaeota bacterium]|nr:rRNA maturation RNase YbeY [Candidatus Sumerlaeota bacterium]